MSEVISLVRSFFEERKWKYTYDESTRQLSAGFNISGKIRNVKMVIDLGYDDCFIVLCPVPINATEEAYPEILRLLNHINFNSKFGTFELDERDGEIRYRITVDCADQLPSSTSIKRSVILPLRVVPEYTEKMIDIIIGGKTFEAIKDALDDESE